MLAGRSLSLIALVAAAGLSLGCNSRPRPLAVEYAGCAEVRAPEPVCVLAPDRELRLWAAAEPEERFEVEPEDATSSVRAVQNGTQWTLRIPPGSTRVVLRSSGSSGSRSVWSLALAEPLPPSAVERAREMAKAGDAEGAERLLAGQRTGKALGYLARLALRKGNTDLAADRLRAALPAHRASQDRLAEVNDATVLVYLEIQARRFAAARQILKGISLPPWAPAEALYYAAYYRGLLAVRVGDPRTALAELGAAADQAERLGMARERWMTQQVRGLQLQSLGRSREAADLFSQLQQSSQHNSPCEFAGLLANRAWALLSAREAGELAPDPTPLYAEVQQILDREACARPDLQVNAAIDLALAHLQAGRVTAARTSLAETHARAHDATPLQRLWWLAIEARLALREARATSALEGFERLAAMAETAHSPDVLWQALMGRARALAALGRRSEALEACATAEALLAGQSLQIPVHEGRETFLAQGESATRFYLELLLASGQPSSALEVVRRARARVLRQLARGDRLARLSAEDQRRWDLAMGDYWSLRADLEAQAEADWQLSIEQLAGRRQQRTARFQRVQEALDRAFSVLGDADAKPDLPPIRPGELVLTYYPLVDGWVGFAATAQKIAVHRFRLPPTGAPVAPRELSQRLLLPFRREIANAEKLRILPYGRLREVDFHALPFGRDVLLAVRPVLYGLDLDARSQPSPAPRRSLVVVDPQGDLRAARAEAAAVIARLRQLRPPWHIEQLAGPAAHAAAVQHAFEETGLFHYAGHGSFAGFGGWESSLPLARQSRLLPGDLLALGGVPSRVVLSGCETGRSAAPAPVEGLGLAQAFLLAGARSVVASTRPIADRATAELLSEFYLSWDGQSDPAVPLRKAQLSWRRRHPGADWASFRLFEP